LGLKEHCFLLTYLQDQLEIESANDALVEKGKLTKYEAEQKTAEWEEREWEERLKALPRKTWIAFVKLQSATILMRLYEYIVSKYCTDDILDRLTKDPIPSSRRKSKRCEERGESNTQLAKSMYRTLLWSSFIGFLADYTVQQVILCGSFYVSYRRRKKAKAKKSDVNNGGIILSLSLKSIQLMFSRIACWVVSSATGAVGGVIYPGYGTLFGAQFGDSALGALLD